MQRHRSLALVASLLAACYVLQASALRAQSADPNATAAEYRKAYAAMAKEDWSKARELLLNVWEKKQTYDVAASLGQVEYKLGHHAAAARYLAFALANVAPSEKPSFIDRLKDGLREVRLRVGSIRVTVNEPDAEVLADSEVIGKSPLPQDVFLEPGSHVVMARKGERIAKADVVSKAGEGFEVTLTLPPEPGPTAPISGLGVEASPAVSADQASAGDAARQTPSLVPVVVGSAVAVVGLATGVALRVSASSSYDDAEKARQRNGEHGCLGSDAPSECRAQEKANQSGDTKTNAATVAFSVGGAALIATAAYWFWPRKQSSAVTFTPHVAVTTSSGFVGISSSF